MNNKESKINRIVRSPPEQLNEINNNNSVPTKVTIKQLKEQVDDLVDNYNELAKKLNRPTLDEIDKVNEMKV